MSIETNTQIIQSCYEKFSKGDIPGILEVLDENILWSSPVVENAPHTGERTGRKSINEFFELLSKDEDITRFEPLVYIAQDDRVCVRGEFAATVNATGRSYESEWVHIFTLRDGKVVNFFELFDTAAATKAYQKAKSA